MPDLKSLLMLLAITMVAGGTTMYIKFQIDQMYNFTANLGETLPSTYVPPITEVAEPEVVVAPPIETPKPKPPVVPPPDKPVMGGSCAVGGCSSQLCGEAADMDGMVTTCEYREQYACYQTAKCERQATGKCGWTETPELAMCLKTNS
jgi:hypothetical protein